jgi:hypothetical protein
MSRLHPLHLLLLSALLVLPLAQAHAVDEGNWKRGRVYYRMTCTTCHKEMLGRPISPTFMTTAQWKNYFARDKHDVISKKSSTSLKYFVSREYRERAKDSNKAAAKFLEIPEAELLADVLAFAVHGAKDSDTPTPCQ